MFQLFSPSGLSMGTILITYAARSLRAPSQSLVRYSMHPCIIQDAFVSPGCTLAVSTIQAFFVLPVAPHGSSAWLCEFSDDVCPECCPNPPSGFNIGSRRLPAPVVYSSSDPLPMSAPVAVIVRSSQRFPARVRQSRRRRHSLRVDALASRDPR